jgi:hypothetical protein
VDARHLSGCQKLFEKEALLPASARVAGLFNQFLQETVYLVKLCLDFRAVFELGLEVPSDFNELVVNDSEDFRTRHLRSDWSCRSRSSSHAPLAA